MPVANPVGNTPPCGLAGMCFRSIRTRLSPPSKRKRLLSDDYLGRSARSGSRCPSPPVTAAATRSTRWPTPRASPPRSCCGQAGRVVLAAVLVPRPIVAHHHPDRHAARARRRDPHRLLGPSPSALAAVGRDRHAPRPRPLLGTRGEFARAVRAGCGLRRRGTVPAEGAARDRLAVMLPARGRSSSGWASPPDRCCSPTSAGGSERIALAIGVPAAALIARLVHQLSRRWVVLVPAGLVVADPLTLTDPVLFVRKPDHGTRPGRSGPATARRTRWTSGSAPPSAPARCSSPRTPTSCGGYAGGASGVRADLMLVTPGSRAPAARPRRRPPNPRPPRLTRGSRIERRLSGRCRRRARGRRA